MNRRATVLSVALLAVTLNFLQPLVHAVMMRDGAPNALWTMFCNAAAADPDSAREPGSAPLPAQATDKHECCLGLAHAPALLEPSASFLPLTPVQTARVQPPATERHGTAAIRDGPHRPRGPPSFFA